LGRKLSWDVWGKLHGGLSREMSVELFGEKMSVGMYISPYRITSLCAVVMIDATLVNTQTHTDSF